ncbi:MAG TPA: hypothetical protein PKB09_01945 [Candidatus Saccharibacteria bacterium]|nr:hypothetical protein [Candidatus Saccharibacteria bacterium]
MGKLKSILRQNWLTVIIFVAVVVGGLFAVFNQLSTIPPGISSPERAFIKSSLSLESITDNPLNAPIKLLFFVVNQLNLDSITVYRGLSGVFGVIFLICFYNYLKHFQTRRVSLLATILLFTSSWFLHNTRLALANILLPLSVMIILMSARKLQQSSNTAIISVLLGIVLGLSLYVPAAASVALLVLIFGLKTKKTKLKFKHLSSFFISLTITIAPLIYASTQNVELIYGIFGLPQTFLPIEWLKRVLAIPIFLFAKGPLNPVTNLARLPILDVFSSALLVLGVYAAYFKVKQPHFRHIILALIASFVLIALNGESLLPVIMPIIYIVLSYGIAIILQQWLTVFPKNPLVKNIGIFIVVISLSFISFYHLKRYFIAWPNSPTTKIVFRPHID